MIKKTNKKLFGASRTNSSQSSASFLDKSLSGSFEEPNLQILKKPGAFLSKQNTMTQSPISSKNAYNIFKTDKDQMEQLLKRYSKENLYYRSEEFSQQSETFITRMASDKKIPNHIKAQFPLQQIFMSISKVFMLNEYEILAFSCTLDHCGWKVDEVIQAEEKNYLDDFPITGIEIEADCKRFIMYLLVIAFSVKQYLNEKTDIEGIQAFCEKTCKDFHIIFNRWASSPPSLQRFTYSAIELNRKYKTLSLRSGNEMHSHLKDYNQLVENIMALTGSYNAKSRARDLQSNNNVYTPPTGIDSSSESRVLFSEGPLQIIPEPEKILSRQGTFESMEGGFWGQLPGSGNNSNFLPSFSQLSTNFASTKKTHQPMDLNAYENIVKKLKYEASTLDEINNKENNESFEIENNNNGGNNLNGSVNGEEFYNVTSGFSKKPSFRFSQLSDDFPAATPQWNFSLTFSQENRGGE